MCADARRMSGLKDVRLKKGQHKCYYLELEKDNGFEPFLLGEGTCKWHLINSDSFSSKDSVSVGPRARDLGLGKDSRNE